MNSDNAVADSYKPHKKNEQLAQASPRAGNPWVSSHTHPMGPWSMVPVPEPQSVGTAATPNLRRDRGHQNRGAERSRNQDRSMGLPTFPSSPAASVFSLFPTPASAGLEQQQLCSRLLGPQRFCCAAGRLQSKGPAPARCSATCTAWLWCSVHRWSNFCLRKCNSLRRYRKEEAAGG